MDHVYGMNLDVHFLSLVQAYRAVQIEYVNLPIVYVLLMDLNALDWKSVLIIDYKRLVKLDQMEIANGLNLNRNV